MLLAPFRLEMLAKSHAPALTALDDRYGERWLRDILVSWSRHPHRWGDGGDRAAWVASLPALAAALRDQRDRGTRVGRLLVEDACSWLAEIVERRREIATPSRRAKALGELARPTLAVLESFAKIGETHLRDRALELLTRDDDTLLEYLIEVLRAGSKLPPSTRTGAGLDAIARHCARRLESRVARPSRAPEDWSIEMPKGCSCALCDTLAAFVSDPAQRILEWPLAQDGRRHVHQRIDIAELPVRHQTRRTGRPYTLVLTKTADIFEREARSRRRDEADLHWLGTHLGRAAPNT